MSIPVHSVPRRSEICAREVPGWTTNTRCHGNVATSRTEISRRLGSEWTGIDTVDGGELLIFRRGEDVARFADYRGSNRFEGFERPFAELSRDGAVLAVRDQVIRPG